MLNGRVVLVTGGGAGIGAAVSKAMAAAGARVVVTDIDGQAAERTAEAAGNGAIGFMAGAGDIDQIDTMVARTAAGFGRLDVIVNNAGITRNAQILAVTEKDWDDIYRINARGVFFCLQRAARQMIDQGGGGRIINIASISGRGFVGVSNAAYAASKGAVVSLTWTAAQQLGRYDINVNAICPGVTTTDLVTRVMGDRARAQNRGFDEVLAQETGRTLTGRLSTPEDIAALAVWLASDAARNVTAQCWNVDGGTVLN